MINNKFCGLGNRKYKFGQWVNQLLINKIFVSYFDLKSFS